MKYEHIFFDMDGTLLKSEWGVTLCLKKTLSQFDIEEKNLKNLKNLKKFIGPPLRSSFAEFCGFSEPQIEKAMQIFRELYESEGIFKSKIYFGIKSLLRNLKKSQKKIYIASSKPEIHIKKILVHNKIEKYFDFVCGSDILETNSKKSAIIQQVVKKMQLENAVKNSQVVMVGDRKYDVEGAAACSIKTIGVLFGYGTKEELEKSGAIAIAKNPRALKKILCSP